jgi:prophage tail gpP-like protein
MPDLILQVNGRKYGGWQSVRVVLGMEQIAGTFELSVSERWPGQPEAWPILPGDACQVLIGDQPVITGYVDDVAPDYDKESHSVRISGRDRTGDLVDCSAMHKSGQWAGVTLDRIAADLCAPFGVKVSLQTDVGAKFGKFALQEAETAFEALDRAAKMRGVLLMSDGKGGLVITRAGSQRIGTALVKGQNVERGSGQFSHKDRFSKYIIKGQTPGHDDSTPEHNAQTKATAEDNAVRRYRPLIVIAEQGDNSTYTDRAKWERNVRAGKASRVTYPVSGWQHTNGLWLPNRLAQVKDDFLGVDGDLLLAQVAFILDESGSRAELELCRKEAFDLVALPEKGKMKKGKKEADVW